MVEIVVEVVVEVVVEIVVEVVVVASPLVHELRRARKIKLHKIFVGIT